TFAATAMAASATTTTANSAPVASPSLSAPDHTTGKVTVSLNATDVDGNPLTYAVSVAPTNGTVTNEGPGSYTYTPTQAGRLAAAQTPGADTDRFTVNVGDGQTTTPVAVTLPISSTQVQLNDPITVGSSPSGMAIAGNYAYVANQGGNTVSVIDLTTGRPVD